MDRNTFLRKGLLGTGILAASGATANVVKNDIDELVPLDIVGFNHLPSQPTQLMENTVLHRASDRGHANHGWLESYHSFSFAHYHNPEKMHFGVLRVLNDDRVAPGMGFGTHPHDNMEIISIPLEGDLEHRDSMGNVAVIRQGDIQVMSAGTGIYHSEYNRNKDSEVKFLQIWVFPNQRNVTPRYDQITLNAEDSRNKFQQILSPSAQDEGVWINQDAWFHLGKFDAQRHSTYQLKKEGNGVYLFVLKGEVQANGQLLHARDGLGVWNTPSLDIQTNSTAELLLMEVPMTI
jgi:quercetin 2,3-dioxygenase